MKAPKAENVTNPNLVPSVQLKALKSPITKAKERYTSTSTSTEITNALILVFFTMLIRSSSVVFQLLAYVPPNVYISNAAIMDYK